MLRDSMDPSFQTPEQVRLNYRLAGPATRLMAFIVDQVVLTAALTIILLVPMALSITFGFAAAEFVLAVGLVVFGFGHILYFTFFEAFRNGQTPGKKIFHIQVVRADGRPLSGQAALIRNIFRWVDMIPLLWLIPFISREHRRLGDWASKSVVVCMGDSQPLNSVLDSQSYAHWEPKVLALTRNELERCDPSTIQLVEEFFARREHLPPGTEASLATELANNVVVHGLGRASLPAVPADRVLTEVYLALRDWRNLN